MSETGFPQHGMRDLLDPHAKHVIDDFDAVLGGYLGEEHKPDGSHGNVVATSVTLEPPDPAFPDTGRVIVQDEDGKTTALFRTRALGTVVEMLRGLAVLLRNKGADGTLVNLTKLGYLQHGSATDPGLELFAQAGSVYSNWALLSGQSSVNTPALIIGNLSTGVDPISIRYRSAATVYELMKTVGGAGPSTDTVTLGSALDSSLQGFWDAVYSKALTLNTTGTLSSQVGVPALVAFSAGNFTGSGAMTWTLTSGDQNSFQYLAVGKQITLSFVLITTSVAGTPDKELRITLPNSWTVENNTNWQNAGWASDNGTLGRMQIRANASANHLKLFKEDPTANWSASTDNTEVRGQITFAIA